VLVAKYGGHILTDVDWSNYRLSPKASNWWKVIALLDNVVPDKSWLSDSIYRKVGNGISTSFWNSKWVGDATLAVVFPRLYSLSNVKDCLVSDILVGGFDLRVWPFSWRRDLFQWEEERLVVLKELLESVTLSGEVDVWCWSPDEKGEFSIKSAYNLLVSEFEDMEEEDGALVKILDQIWESPTPSKVIAFSWQLLYDRIPSRCNLRYRGVVLSDIPWECVGCVGMEEDTTHLFLHCPSAMLVLREIFKWIGVFIIIPPSIPSLFVILKGLACGVKMRRDYLLIWHATLWSLWKARNSALFAKETFNPWVVIDDIKVLSWKWVLSRLKVAPCLFYEWIWDPGDCLLR
jgi:hypothetical protein